MEPPPEFRFALARAVLRLRSRDRRASGGGGGGGGGSRANAGALALVESLGLGGDAAGTASQPLTGSPAVPMYGEPSAGPPIERCLIQLSHACFSAGSRDSCRHAALAALAVARHGDREVMEKAAKLVIDSLGAQEGGRGGECCEGQQSAVRNLAEGLLEICMHPLRSMHASVAEEPPTPSPPPEAKARAAWCLLRLLCDAPREHSEPVFLVVAQNVLAAAVEASDPDNPSSLSALTALPIALEVLREGARRVFALPPAAERTDAQLSVLNAASDVCCCRLPSLRARARAHQPLDLLWEEIERTKMAVTATIREAAAESDAGAGGCDLLHLRAAPNAVGLGFARRLASRASQGLVLE